MRRFIRYLAITYLGYLSLCVLVLMPALNTLPHWYVKQATGRQLATEIIFFNPFTLSLEVHRAELPEHDGERFAALDRAAVNLSLSSLWRPGWHFDALQVDELYLHIRQLAADRFNFSDMMPEEARKEPPAEEPAAIPGVTIDDFAFHSQRIIFSDETRPKPFNSTWDDLSISVHGLSTVMAEGRPYTIDLKGEYGGTVHWEGELSIPAATGSGRLELAGLYLPLGWRFIEPWVNFELLDGRLHMAGDYELAWRDELSYRVTDASLSLVNIAIKPKSPEALPDTAIDLADITAAGVELDGPARHIDINTITVDGLAIAGFSEGQQVSLVDLFSAATAPDADAGERPADEAEDSDASITGGAAAADAEKDWTAEIDTFQIRNNSLRWRSEFTEPPLLQVIPIEARADNITWPLSGGTDISLSLAINEQARLAVDGVLALATGGGDIRYSLAGLPLPWFNPNFPAALKARITAGRLGADGTLALQDFAPTVIRLNGAIEGFAASIEDTETALTSWDGVRVEELLVDLEGRSVSLAKLALDNYAGRLHIRQDGSINSQRLWVAEESEGIEANAVGPAEAAQAGEPWAVSVSAIVVTDSEIDFMDESLPISFRTVIGDLHGDIIGLGTASAAAKIDLQGSVDGYAPVTLAGTAAPFSQPPALDLGLSLDGVDLAALTPYSATYAGYSIEQGLLKLSLNYSLNNARLQGNNKVLIDRLKLGEKVQSDKAVDLPLKLALALLTDANGVIDLEVPVSGDVDDPKFSLGSVIAGAFVNLITKAVTAPFTLLASLVNSEENLQRVIFPSGSPELDDRGKLNLDQLVEALSQRPELSLVITGRLKIDADRERLQKNALQATLVEEGLSQEEVDSRGPAWEGAIRSRYDEQIGERPEGATAVEQYRQLAKTIEIADSELLDLALARATAVKGYLVTAQLEGDRAVIEQPRLEDEANQFSGVELDVDI